MKYESHVFCAVCKDYTMHYGWHTGNERCIRHEKMPKGVIYQTAKNVLKRLEEMEVDLGSRN